MKELIKQALGAVVTATYVLALLMMFPIGGPDLPFRTALVGSFVVMAACGFALGRRTRPAWPIVLFGLVRVAGGVFANAIYDSIVRNIDHNLFPIEIVIFAVLVMPGLVGGVAIAQLGVALGKSVRLL